jgi:hypothetical protein
MYNTTPQYNWLTSQEDCGPYQSDIGPHCPTLSQKSYKLEDKLYLFNFGGYHLG